MTEAAAPLRVALTTLGCKVNYAEMADLAGVLAAAGLDVVDEDDHADVRVLNSCAVTAQADTTTRQRLSRLRRTDPDCHLVVTGCSVDANPDQYNPAAVPASMPGRVDAVFSNVKKPAIAEHILGLAASRTAPTPLTAATRARAFIKIQDGCDHRCTYCIVWRTRGASTSLSVDDVMRRIDAAVAAGNRELVLTGVDLGAWGRDIGDRLSNLLGAALTRVGSDARVRLSSINANDITPDLIALNGHPQLCPHWHLPLQSGSDALLKAMHRGYRRGHYLRVVAELRQQDPTTEFTTDIMTGFPGETADDHVATVALVRAVGFLGCHIFRFSARPDTPAARIPSSVSDQVAHLRSAELHKEANRAAEMTYRRAVGRVHEVVWDRVDDTEAHGLSATYHEVTITAPTNVEHGGVDQVVAESAEGCLLRARLLRP